MEIAATEQWFDCSRFAGIVRLYTARQVTEQRGTIASDHTVAREAAVAFYDRLRQLFAQRKCITTFGRRACRRAGLAGTQRHFETGRILDELVAGDNPRGPHSDRS